MAIEDEFDIEIPDEDAEEFKNLGDIVHYEKKNVVWFFPNYIFI